jgi:ParB/RepB/Spo0J family partition protein
MPKNPKSSPSSPSGSPELPPPPPNPEVQQIALRDISPSLYQPRRFQIPDAEDRDLVELARSIRAKGVIQPILLRPLESGYQLVAGERRVRASRLELSELDAIAPASLYIPAIVRELSDTEAAEITVEENLRRKDLRPLEEADGVHTLLLLHKGDPFAVAARLGQTPAWVACRARIHSNLSPAWKELLGDRDSPLWFWTAGHIEEVAKLAQEVQDEILGNFNFDGIDVTLTVPELRRYLADLTRNLGRAPFPLDDETLLASAGACTDCPLTTLATPLLFVEQGDDAPATIKDARCLNRSCWIEKCHRSAERAAARLRADHADLLLVAPREAPSEEIPSSWRGGGLLLPAHAYEKVKKSTEGAQPAMVAGGPQSGRLIWVKPTSPARPRPPLPEIPTGTPSPEAAAPSPDILAERRAKHQNRRIARMAEITRQLLEACDGKSLPLETLLALARTFGTNQSLKGVWNFNSSSDPWADFDAFCGLSAEDAAAEIWTCQLEPVLASRLQYCGPNDAERLHGEILAALKLIGASCADLYRTVAKELPEPKAWVKLPGYEPENLDGEPPAPGNLLRFEPEDDSLAAEHTEVEAIIA